MTQKNNPLHGITLEKMILSLVEKFGWEQLGNKVSIRCFTHDPSVKSSLKFLRKQQWAREKVEQLYLEIFCASNLPTKNSSGKLNPANKQINSNIWNQ